MKGGIKEGGGVAAGKFGPRTKRNMGGNEKEKAKVETEKVPFKELSKELLDKFLGNFNVVSQEGTFVAPPSPLKDPKNEVKQPGSGIRPKRQRSDGHQAEG